MTCRYKSKMVFQIDVHDAVAVVGRTEHSGVDDLILVTMLMKISSIGVIV